ncbi:sugar kinase [Rossellomorea marisflavi]|uniref:sugar kinase n=1 Tax=Rossellomorea marisflavi TaxID=189381 RepID=UPI0034587746
MDVVAIGETLLSLTPAENGLLRHAESLKPKVAGAETNTLIGLSRLGHQTGWISAVGNDEIGERIVATVRGEGIDTAHVKKDEEHNTGIFFKEIIGSGEVRVQYFRAGSAASHMEPADLPASYIRSAKYLYITGITPALSETCKQMIFEAIKLARESGVRVVFDPNLRRKLWGEEEAKTTLTSLCELSDIVLIGGTEGKFLFGTTDTDEIAHRLFKSPQTGLVVVKKGARGAAYALRGREAFQVEPYPVTTVVDPVGAGDGFAAGFLSGMLHELKTEESVRMGCAVGAMVTMVSGDYEGMPDERRLHSFLSRDREDIER